MIKLIAACFALYASSAFAVLEVTVLKTDEDAFPIVISPFSVTGDAKQGEAIAHIMRDNFNRSGEFNASSANQIIDDQINFKQWQAKKIEAIVIGKLDQVSQKIFNVEIELIDTYSKKTLYAKKFAVHNSGIRRIAHYLSDQIYFALLGIKGSFDTRLAYVTVANKGQGKREYRLEISDSDAQNPQTIFRAASPILSPAWSPDQNKIAYVSFKNGRSEVFIQYPFMRRKTQKLPYFDGIASAPAWHPNGESIVLTLSKDGNKDIYAYHLTDKKLTRLTQDVGIDTEASFSPDGERIAFTSNRSGQVQVYIKHLASGKIKRATFDGSYNAKAVFSPDGKSLALVHRLDRDYRIAMLDIATQDLTIMTSNKLDESPFFSPNGSMIIYATNKGDTGVLSVVSILGQQTFELASKAGEVREPNWSHYSK
ncbi:MAG: Tol-Pal system beta propeller repeat protein TolB [Candidatus Thioglobus sp.]|nr:Tol-Pal system beta propeller repeat protein TolB [Candidatus Thioglobus pontius]MBL6976528.1 Tol-Pal system beta propeller repeat protein TolB [Candidatus Thioglobus sp.]MBL6983985.1 Tol-Pal system beta propeller repeat protein TolB [Candidatus Thioglobus sp.]